MDKNKLKQKYPQLIDEEGQNLVNSSVAEQLMNILGSFKHVTNKMCFEKQRFWILWLMWDLNQFKYLERHKLNVAQHPGPSWPY